MQKETIVVDYLRKESVDLYTHRDNQLKKKYLAFNSRREVRVVTLSRGYQF